MIRQQRKALTEVWGLVMVVLLGVSGCSQEPNPFGKLGKGTIQGDTYSNEFFGFSLSLPEGWYVLSEAQRLEDGKGSLHFIPPHDPKARQALRHTKGSMLLIVSKYPFGRTQGLNPSLVVQVQDMTPYRDKVTDGADYLHLLAQELERQPKTQEIGHPRGLMISGQRFHRLDTALSLRDTRVQQRIFATLIKDYLLLMNISAEGGPTLDELVRTVEGINFSAPRS